MAETYGQRPSSLLFPSGDLEPYPAYCFDEAVWLRGSIEAGRASKERVSGDTAGVNGDGRLHDFSTPIPSEHGDTRPRVPDRSQLARLPRGKGPR